MSCAVNIERLEPAGVNVDLRIMLPVPPVSVYLQNSNPCAFPRNGRRARVEASKCIQRHYRGVLGRKRALQERKQRQKVTLQVSVHVFDLLNLGWVAAHGHGPSPTLAGSRRHSISFA